MVLYIGIYIESDWLYHAEWVALSNGQSGSELAEYSANKAGHAGRYLFCYKVMHGSLPSASVHRSSHHNFRKEKIDDETLVLRVSSSISTEVYLFMISSISRLL